MDHAGSAYEKANNRINAVLTGVEMSPLAVGDLCLSGKQRTWASPQVRSTYRSTSLQSTRRPSRTLLRSVQGRVFESTQAHMDWMDEETRRRAKEKAEAIELKVGYPDFILDPKRLDEYYLDFNVTDSAFINVINYIKFVIRRSIKKYGMPPDRNEWNTNPAEVNAFYSLPNENEVIIPAGILQPPFYHHSFPKSMVFGVNRILSWVTS